MIRGVFKKPKILHRGDSSCLKHLQNVYFARHESTLNLSRLDQHLYESRVSKVTENLDQNYPLISDVRNAQTKLFMPKKLEVIRVPEFMDKYNHLQNMEKDSNSLHIIEGKVRNIRKSSKKLVFIDLIQDFNKVQLVYSLNTINEHMKSNMSPEAFLQSYESLKIGDSISFAGFPFRTKSGELSVRSTSPLRSLSPALLPIDRELDPKNKFVNYKISNYLANRASVTPLVVKHLITSAMRDFLIKKHNFIEVETPIISNTANGANANPFVTSSPHIKKNITDGKPLDLNLRIAPELYLKKLVIGGFDKVFEIGKMFRNEGIDAYHNPEFTTCEFYQSFTDLNGLIKLTEDMLVFILDAVKKNLLSGTSNFANQDTVISNIESILSSFQKEARTTVVNSDKDYSSCTNDDNIINNSTKIRSRYFQLLEFIPTIEQQASEKLPENIDDLAQLKKFFEKTKTILPSVVSVPNLLDKLAGRFIEPLCIQPTLIINHPVQMSPLSKSFVKSYDDRCYEVANRFELFINSQEYINAYEEENSPVKQSKKFEAQLAFKNNSNDAEIAMIPDSSFTKAMELGMPPTGGWGCGIDRLAMLVSGAKKIDDVLTFGNLKDNIKY